MYAAWIGREADDGTVDDDLAHEPIPVDDDLGLVPRRDVGEPAHELLDGRRSHGTPRSRSTIETHAYSSSNSLLPAASNISQKSSRRFPHSERSVIIRYGLPLRVIVPYTIVILDALP